MYILDGTIFQKFCSQFGNILLSKVKIKLYAYGNTTLKVIGKLSYVVEIQHRLLPLEFPVKKEAHVVVFATERFRTYINGLQFTLVTGHKPLEYLFHKTCSRPSMHVEK